LVPAIAGIGLKFIVATQALAGGRGTHRRAQNAPLAPHIQTHPREEKSPPAPPRRRRRKKTQEEEFYWKFSKKIQRKRHPTFKPPESSGFQIAARN
jgi:hypothetical protein